MSEGLPQRRFPTDVELGMLEQHPSSPGHSYTPSITSPNSVGAFPDAYLNPHSDPMSPPLVWKSENPNHLRQDSIKSDLVSLLRRPGTGTTLNSNASGMSSRTVSVQDVSTLYKGDVKGSPGAMQDLKYLPDSRPATPSVPFLRKETPLPEDYCPVSAEAMIPLPRPSKDAPPPPKKQASLWIRANLWYNTYRKFFTIAVLVNGALIILYLAGHFGYGKKYIGAMVLGNFTATILVRNELFGRLLYLIVNTCFAKWTPLWFRLACTSTLQHLGGIHSGCAVSGITWLLINIVTDFKNAKEEAAVTLAAGTVTIVAMAISMAAAFPWVRNNHHNIFERYHRFVGWTGLVATWFFVVLGDLWNVDTRAFELSPMRVFGTQAFWFALSMTIFVILPWCFIRKVPVEIEIPSPKVAILKFERGMQQGLLARVSRSAIKEYHAFGIISAGTRSNSHYLICGVQGDFTKSLVNDPPSHIWTRELKFAGVSNTTAIYKRGIRVCTGTGLGAALSSCVQSPNWFLIWIGADMEKTFGPTISALIHDNIGPERRILWDSKARGGRPNTMKILKEVYHNFGAEVVFITSNYEGNKELMEGCKESGIPAFGTLWDF